MSNLGKLFGTDGGKEKDGVVFQYSGDIRVRLARAGGANDRFAKVTEEVTRPYRRMIDHDLLQNDTAKDIAHEIFARAVVLEWSGVKDDDGKDIPYSVEAALALFNEAPDFFTFVAEEARRLANYRAINLQADAKNSASA